MLDFYYLTVPIRRHILKRSVAAHLRAISIDADALEPLYRQLYFAIRDGILSERLRPGQRLPATRSFAQDLGPGVNIMATNIRFNQLDLADWHGLGKRVGHIRLCGDVLRGFRPHDHA